MAIIVASPDLIRVSCRTPHQMTLANALCRALGLLASGGDWRDHSYGLTGTGKSTALEALRARATGPRTIPWP